MSITALLIRRERGGEPIEHGEAFITEQHLRQDDLAILAGKATVFLQRLFR